MRARRLSKQQYESWKRRPDSKGNESSSHRLSSCLTPVSRVYPIFRAERRWLHTFDQGMTTANMKLVVVEVVFPDKLEFSDAKLDDGEHIVKRVVELPKLADELAGKSALGS